jgi:hypothetical protein
LFFYQNDVVLIFLKKIDLGDLITQSKPETQVLNQIDQQAGCENYAK